MTTCLNTAISQGFREIMVTPHLDHALDTYQWRNYLKLNPTQEIGGWSYWDIQVGAGGGPGLQQVINQHTEIIHLLLLLLLGSSVV